MRLRYLAIGMITVLLASCGSARDQAASEAIVGAHALAQWAPADTGARILAGVQDFILATRGASSIADLPPPVWDVDAVVADPDAYAADGQRAREQQAGGLWAWFAGGALLAVGVASALLKATGLGGPVVNVVVGLVSALAERKASRAVRAKQRELADLAQIVVHAVEDVDATAVKQAVNRVVTHEQRVAIAAALATHGSPVTDTPSA